MPKLLLHGTFLLSYTAPAPYKTRYANEAAA